MATITKRGPHQYQVQIRRKGFPEQHCTFETKHQAEAWARTLESEMDRGIFIDRSEAERTSLAEALDRYAKEVTPHKRSWSSELSCIKTMRRHPLAARALATLRGSDFAAYRDERLQCVAPNTVRLELALFSHLFNTVAREWSIPIANPIAAIRKPKPPRGRDRRLVGDEEERLLAGAEDSHAPTLAVCIRLAIHTGMRAGEIVQLTWEQIDLATHVIRLDMTKNGERRIVPLTIVAEAALRTLARPIHGGRVMSFHDSNGLGAAFRRACARAGITDLRFHDLRHEAASRFAPNMPVATLAKVMGWKSIQMAMRYYNPTPAELVTAVRRIKTA